MRLRPRSTIVPAPINVLPSQQFEGDDGQWSTFSISVGTPQQIFRVLISTATSETWVIAPEGCTSSDPSNCQSLRGGQPFNGIAPAGFLTNQSSTWNQAGLYTLDAESALGYHGNGIYGYDVVGLNGGNSSSGGNGISLPNQVVAGIADKTFFTGIFGLGINPTSFSSSAPTVPSFLLSLWNNKQIPSLSYSYAAGAVYENKQTFGSLVLGGYDTTRLKNGSRSISFASSAAAALRVGVQSIIATNTLNGTASMTTSGGHLSIIDSTVPHLWLPRSVCDTIALALGLQYDPQTDLYLVPDTAHQRLVSDNPTFTFKIGDTAYDDGNSTNIILPYAAFDLQVGWPIYQSSVNYFPIRRGANSTQYVLGRAFLQEAYLIVDYERKNFTIGAAAFPDSSVKSHIVSIKSTGKPLGSKNGLSGGAIAGIVIGALAALLLIAGFFWWFRQRRSAKKTRVAELEAKQKHESLAYQKVHQDMDNMVETGGTEIVELDPGYDNTFKPAQEDGPTELPGPDVVYEMEGDSTITTSNTYSPRGHQASPPLVSPATPGTPGRR